MQSNYEGPPETTVTSDATAPNTHRLSGLIASPFGTLFTRTLPRYGGPHQVGVRDVEIPVPMQKFGDFILKTPAVSTSKLEEKTEEDAGNLVMDTVLFTLFYPAVGENPPSEQRTKKNSVIWFPRLPQTVDGFLRMAGRIPNWLYRAIAYPLAAAVIYGVTFPGLPSAPLLAPPQKSKYPLVLFSPGAGTSRLMYSALCAEIASRGYVVTAIEHRDGTSPASTVLLPNGKTKTVSWLQWNDLYWPTLDEQPKDDTQMRRVQVDMRVAEISETWRVVREIVDGTSDQQAPDFDWSLWRDKVDCSDGAVYATGHSLGGTAIIKATSGENPTPFKQVLAFDPALQRIDPEVVNLDPSITRPPLLVLNSGGFTKDPDWGRLKSLSAKWKGAIRVGWQPGTTHPAISDLPLILPQVINKLTGLRVDPQASLRLTMDAILKFMRAGANVPLSSSGGRDEAVWARKDDGKESFRGRETIVWCIA